MMHIEQQFGDFKLVSFYEDVGHGLFRLRYRMQWWDEELGHMLFGPEGKTENEALVNFLNYVRPDTPA